MFQNEDQEMYNDSKIRALAKIVHNANKAYCEAIGDYSQKDWEDTPTEIQNSAVKGVSAVLEDPSTTPKDLHDKWVIAKVQDGWVYEKKKDLEKKTHPCLVDYDKLSVEQRFKDSLFLNIVKTYIDFKAHENKEDVDDE